MDELCRRVKATNRYGSLKEKHRKGALKGDWRVGRSWEELFELAGLNPRTAQIMYRYTSSYVHGDSLSTLQIETAELEKDQSILAEGHLRMLLFVMTRFIEKWATRFPAARRFLSSNKDSLRLVAYDDISD